MKRKLLAAAAGLVALLALAAPAHADGNGSQTYTQTVKDAVVTMPAGAPCLPDGTITLTYNGVFHYTVNKAGDYWDTGTMTGEATLVPADPTQPTYTGHAVSWFGDSLNNQNAVSHFTINAHLTSPGGASLDWHENGHLSLSASGVTVSFDKAVC